MSSAVFPTRWLHTVAVTLPHATQYTSKLAVELPTIRRQPPSGVCLRCWISAWCLGLVQPGGEMGWVFRDEVSVSAYAALHRRVLLGI